LSSDAAGAVLVCLIAGWYSALLEDSRFLDLVHPDDIEAGLGAIDTLKKQGEILSFIDRYRCKEGSYKWLEWKSLPKGNKIIAAARDITAKMNSSEIPKQCSNG